MRVKDIWVIGLALLLSPIPACAQMVCDIDCSLQNAARREVGTSNETTDAQRSEDADVRSSHRHCDEGFAGADSAQGAAQPMNPVCHGAKCATDLGQRVSSTAQIKLRAASAGLVTTVEMNGRPFAQKAEARIFSVVDRHSAVGVLQTIGVLRI